MDIITHKKSMSSKLVAKLYKNVNKIKFRKNS